MSVNEEKTKVVHFRNPSVPPTNFMFWCGPTSIARQDIYTYLGLVLTEHLDFDIMAKTVAQSPCRALGVVIAKCKSGGGFAVSTFQKLYESTSIVAHGPSSHTVTKKPSAISRIRSAYYIFSRRWCLWCLY